MNLRVLASPYYVSEMKPRDVMSVCFLTFVRGTLGQRRRLLIENGIKIAQLARDVQVVSRQGG